MKLMNFEDQSKYSYTFEKIYEFPHRAYLTHIHHFLDQSLLFNRLSKLIQDKRDTIFIVNHEKLIPLLDDRINVFKSYKLQKNSYEIVIKDQNDLIDGTLYIYLHHKYERIVIDNCGFQRCLILAKRLVQLTLRNTTIIYLNVHRSKQLKELVLEERSKIERNNMKISPDTKIIEEDDGYEISDFPQVDEFDVSLFPPTDFLSSDSDI